MAGSRPATPSMAAAVLAAVLAVASSVPAAAEPVRPRRLNEIDWRQLEDAPAAHAAELIALCADPAARSRTRAAAALRRVADAEVRETVVASLASQAHTARRLLVPVVAAWGDAQTPPRWFRYALDADEGVRDAVSSALGAGSVEGLLAFRAWVAAGDAADRVAAEHLERRAVGQIVARRLIEIAPDGTTWGLYDGQFGNLLTLGPIAVEAAEAIVQRPSTAFPKAVDRHLEGLQFLALGMLAEARGPEALAALRRCRALETVSEQVKEVALLGLWRNGETAPLNQAIDDLKRRAAAGQDPLALGRAAYLMGLIGRYAEAIELYLKLHEVSPRGGNAAYNISNLYCRMGDTKRTFEYLALAVDSGFLNARWAKQDRDLKEVWEAEEFLVLVAVMEEMAENGAPAEE